MTTKTKITYTVAEAAEATGVSVRTIDRAINSGDLAATRPTVNGRPLAKSLIAAAELQRWATSSTR